MKKLSRILTLLVLTIIFGCSSSSDSDSNLSTENSFSVTIDGTLYTFNNFAATKQFDNYEALGWNDNDENFYLRFNEDGILATASFYSTDFTNDFDFSTSYYFPSEVFSLHNLTIDLDNMVINADFDGLIYEEEFNLDAGTNVTVNSGTFNLVFTELFPQADQHLDAEINGNDFKSVKHDQSGGFFDGEDISLCGLTDGEISICINFNPDTTEAGTYTFSSNQEIESISVQSINPYTDESSSYETSGTLIIEEHVTSFASYVRGSFTLTATGNGETLNIENGTFLLFY